MSRALVVCVAVGLAACGASTSSTGSATLPATSRPAASANVVRAEELMAAGDFAQADALLRSVVTEHPKDARAWFDLGYVAEELGDPKRAVEAYRKAADLAPNFAEAHNNLGVLLREQGDLPEALRVLKRATELDPKFADAHLNLAMTLEDLRRTDDARKSYARAQQLAPRDVMIRVNLGFLELETGDVQRAKALFLSARPLASGDASWLTAIGSGLRRAEAFDSALDALHAAEALKPEAIDRVWSEIALAHYGAGDLDKAETYLRKSLRVSRDDISLQYALGAVLLKKARVTSGAASKSATREGRRLLKQVIARDPHGPHADRARKRLQSAEGK